MSELDPWEPTKPEVTAVLLAIPPEHRILITEVGSAVGLVRLGDVTRVMLRAALESGVMHPSNDVVTCVYCGLAYPPGTPRAGAAILREHIAKCEKHPMRAFVRFAESIAQDGIGGVDGPLVIEQHARALVAALGSGAPMPEPL
jgi:hypothetical protein